MKNINRIVKQCVSWGKNTGLTGTKLTDFVLEKIVASIWIDKIIKKSIWEQIVA